MTDAISLLFSQEFLSRALIVGVLISLCCALLGVSLVLKRFSMIGDGLSHVGFGAMAIGAAAGVAPLYFALPIVIVAAFLLLRMSEKGKIKGDAAIALISTGALAVGVMVTSMTTGMNVDIYNYMFGSILTMGEGDVVISSVLSLCVIGLFIIFYREIFAVTFDENFAKATGTKASAYNMLIAALTAVTIVIGMKMMGALLISSLIIFPTVSSMRLCKSFRSVVTFSSVISVLCFLSGLILSIKYEAPTGASVVCVNIFLLGVLSLVRHIKLANIKISLKCLAIAVTAVLSLSFFIFAMMQGETYEYKKDKTTIVATSFAPYDFARQIAGENAEVIMLLAPGEESHTYEPTPGDIMKIQQCDLFVYGGGESESWVDSILDSFDEAINTVKMMDVVELYEEEHNHSEEEHHHEDGEYDEHVWTSPLNAVEIVEAISFSLQQTDNENAQVYAETTEKYLTELRKLDAAFVSMISASAKNKIVIGDRFPLMYFTERYGLGYESAFPGCSAQTEANPATISRLIDAVKNENISTVFKVDLSKGSVAFTISEAADTAVGTLYSCHVISAEDFEAGETYVSLMKRNYEALKRALN
ncbi:MAG: zinc ABC transporter substrate-binding protein [Clostridia bacterium]|nr:zinc ABC transporter substrate-binding protein [Clostridia bacterium]